MHHVSDSGHGRADACAPVNDARDGDGDAAGGVGEADVQGGSLADVAGFEWECV